MDGTPEWMIDRSFSQVSESRPGAPRLLQEWIGICRLPTHFAMSLRNGWGAGMDGRSILFPGLRIETWGTQTLAGTDRDLSSSHPFRDEGCEMDRAPRIVGWPGE